MERAWWLVWPRRCLTKKPVRFKLGQLLWDFLWWGRSSNGPGERGWLLIKGRGHMFVHFLGASSSHWAYMNSLNPYSYPVREIDE